MSAKGGGGTNQSYTNADRDVLRRAGISVLVESDGGEIYVLGSITSASTALRVTLATNQIMREVEALARWFADEQGAAVTRCREPGIPHPEFRLAKYPGLSCFAPMWAIRRAHYKKTTHPP